MVELAPLLALAADLARQLVSTSGTKVSLVLPGAETIDRTGDAPVTVRGSDTPVKGNVSALVLQAGQVDQRELPADVGVRATDYAVLVLPGEPVEVGQHVLVTRTRDARLLGARAAVYYVPDDSVAVARRILARPVP